MLLRPLQHCWYDAALFAKFFSFEFLMRTDEPKQKKLNGKRFLHTVSTALIVVCLHGMSFMLKKLAALFIRSVKFS